MEEREKSENFCATNKCLLCVMTLVAAAIIFVVCFTFLSPAVRSPHPHKQTDLKWWQTTIIYQVYPRSFQDSNGDGVGDIPGITSRLAYFNDINVNAIWLNPFYASPMRDMGYDVSNYTVIAPVFGSMDDFDSLLKEARRKGIKVIVDFVPNHTSNDSRWFRYSRQGVPPYSGYYIWNPGRTMPDGTRVPPNNWVSSFGGSAWTWDDVRGEFFYHHYLKSQPDLNYRNEHVLNEIDNVLRFWLDRGVDGFRIDALSHLFEIENQNLNEAQKYQFTRNQPEIFSVVRRWKKIVDSYIAKDGIERLLIAEVANPTQATQLRFYEEGTLPLFYDLADVQKRCGFTAECFRTTIQNGLNTSGHWPNFVLGSHDNPRIADRLGSDYANALNMLLLTLPGTPTSYYGEELGMVGGNYTGLPPQDTKAIQSHNISLSRDPERNPMQWDNTQNAGFSKCDHVTDPAGRCPWLAVTPNTNFSYVNVQTQNRSSLSSLSVYKALSKLRQQPEFQNTFIEFPEGNSRDVLVFLRGQGSVRYATVINLGSGYIDVNLAGGFTEGTVAVSTKGRSLDKINLSSILLEKGEGLVIRLT